MEHLNIFIPKFTLPWIFFFQILPSAWCTEIVTLWCAFTFIFVISMTEWLVQQTCGTVGMTVNCISHLGRQENLKENVVRTRASPRAVFWCFHPCRHFSCFILSPGFPSSFDTCYLQVSVPVHATTHSFHRAFTESLPWDGSVLGMGSIAVGQEGLCWKGASCRCVSWTLRTATPVSLWLLPTTAAWGGGGAGTGRIQRADRLLGPLLPGNPKYQVEPLFTASKSA